MSNLSKIFFQQTNYIPIWLMRQAGRFLPEYRNIRSSLSNFLELCYNSNLAYEVAMQPIDRFNFDAAILFSDILVIPDAMGYEVKFIKDKGPQLQKISLKDIEKLHKYDFNILLDKLKSSYDTIKKLRTSLSYDKSVIGFCGAPWTVATYMINGGSSQDHSYTRLFAYKEKKSFLKLLDFLAELSALYLIEQIKSGADIVQIFDSWAGILSYDEFEDYCIKPSHKIVEIINKKFPNIPIIGFPKGSNCFLNEYIKNTKISGLSVDWRIDYKTLNSFKDKVVIQGNLDPLILVSGGKLLENKIEEIIDNLGKQKFIFNLGHGILPQTPIENVKFLVEKVKSYNV